MWSLRSRTGDARALWVLGPHAGYGKKVVNARVTVPDLSPGKYQLDWWDDVTGSILGPPVTVESTGAPTTIDVPPLEDDVSRFDLGRLAVLAALEDQFLTVVQSAVGREAVDVLRFRLERVEVEPLDQGVEHAVLFEDEERVMVPTVLAN